MRTISYYLRTLNNGDVIVFKDITAKDCSGQRGADSLVLTVTDAHKYMSRFVSDTIVIDPITQDSVHITNKYFYNRVDKD